MPDNGPNGELPRVADAINDLRSESELRRFFFSDRASFFSSGGGEAPIGLSFLGCSCELEGLSSNAPRTVGRSLEIGRLFGVSIDLDRVRDPFERLEEFICSPVAALRLDLLRVLHIDGRESGSPNQKENTPLGQPPRNIGNLTERPQNIMSTPDSVVVKDLWSAKGHSKSASMTSNIPTLRPTSHIRAPSTSRPTSSPQKPSPQKLRLQSPPEVARTSAERIKGNQRSRSILSERTLQNRRGNGETNRRVLRPEGRTRTSDLQYAIP